MRGVYAHQCQSCTHLTADHRLVLGADREVERQYCLYCACKAAVGDPCTPLTRRQYDALPDEVRNPGKAS